MYHIIKQTINAGNGKTIIFIDINDIINKYNNFSNMLINLIRLIYSISSLNLSDKKLKITRISQ